MVVILRERRDDMSRFNYSEEELELNKVIKMNQSESLKMKSDEEMKKIRKIADDRISSSIELLRLLGKGEDVENLSAQIQSRAGKRKLDNKPQVQSWDKLVAEAEEYCSDIVTLEDILTEEEIRASEAELDEIYRQFSKKTGIINKTDLSFLAVATALQVTKSLVFPYIAKKFDYGQGFDSSKRMAHNDKSIEKAHREANDKFRDEHLEKHGTGRWMNIIYQTVPYDITKGSADLGINMGGKYHRMYTLGHDPMLGWLFGTANILTDCITFNTFQTNRISRIDPITGGKKMVITAENVPLGKMFTESIDYVKADYLNLPAAIFAQAQHLKSDEYTKVGLPLPILPSINEKFASRLYSEQYDYLCGKRDFKIVASSAFVSMFIDTIIGLVHGMFRKEGEDRDLYEVRTRKILLISNAMASTSTIIKSTFTNDIKNLDIGTLINTLLRLFLDIGFMAKIKREYIEREISIREQKVLDEVDSLYEEWT